jgi:DNA-binding transcriptional LysR family regulator
VSGNLQACSGEPTVEAALAGLGISLIAGWMIQDELAKGLLIPLLPDWRASIYEEESAGLYAVFRGDRFQRPAVRAFIDFLVEKLPQRLNGLD